MDAFSRIPKWAATEPSLNRTAPGISAAQPNADAALSSLPLQTASIPVVADSLAQSSAPNIGDVAQPAEQPVSGRKDSGAIPFVSTKRKRGRPPGSRNK